MLACWLLILHTETALFTWLIGRRLLTMGLLYGKKRAYLLLPHYFKFLAFSDAYTLRSWPLAMMARGLELQLSRCASSSAPLFCSDQTVYPNVKTAYNTLWDSIEANSAHLSTEVWSWTYDNGMFKYIDLGALPPPPGSSPTESDIVQLWSLTFLAVKRNLSW